MSGPGGGLGGGLLGAGGGVRRGGLGGGSMDGGAGLALRSLGAWGAGAGAAANRPRARPPAASQPAPPARAPGPRPPPPANRRRPGGLGTAHRHAPNSGPGLSCELPRQRRFPPSRSSRRRAARPSPLASDSHPPQLVSRTSEQPLLLRPFASTDSPLLRAPQRIPHFSELQLFFREVLTLLRAPTHGSRFPSTPAIHLQKPRAHTPPGSPMVLGTRAPGLLAFPLGTCHERRRCVG